MKDKRLYILAPNDRFNYGDLIFPYILKYYLSDITRNFVFCSTTESDLSVKGGMRTKGFSTLYKMNPHYDNYLIIAGGESLFVPWWPILSYTSKLANFIQFQLNRLYFHIGIKAKIPGILRDRIIDFTLKQVFRFKTKYPFTICKFEIDNLTGIYYNSVGNINLINDKHNVTSINKRILNSADYISVRDKNTSKFLENLGINHVIAPDSAILISDIFGEEYLLQHINSELMLSFANLKFIFFQINLITWINNKDAIIKQLLSILKDTNNITICLCAIGTATGHEDNKALSEIYNKIHQNRVKLIEHPSLWEIMWLIKHSQLYIGTSLHGIITSLSFNVPYLAYSVGKVEAYLKQWTNDANKHFCKIEEISTYASILLNTPNKTLSESVIKQKQYALLSIKNIHDKIMSSI